MEDALLLHTQEVPSSSLGAPTIVFRKLEAIGFIRTGPCPHGCPHRLQFVAVFGGRDPPPLVGGRRRSVCPAFDPARRAKRFVPQSENGDFGFLETPPQKNIWLCTPHSPLDDASYDFETQSRAVSQFSTVFRQAAVQRYNFPRRTRTANSYREISFPPGIVSSERLIARLGRLKVSSDQRLSRGPCN